MTVVLLYFPSRKLGTASYYLVILDVVTTLLGFAEILRTSCHEHPLVSIYLLVNPLQ